MNRPDTVLMVKTNGDSPWGSPLKMYHIQAEVIYECLHSVISLRRYHIGVS